MQRQEAQIVLRLVSPRMFLSLWMLLVLAVGGGVIVWSIQKPVIVQGKGYVVQPKTAPGEKAQGDIVLLLFPPDQQAHLKIGQSVSISIAAANITFNSTIQTIEIGVMSPASIGSQINLQPSLALTIAGPAIVVFAPVEPMSLAQTYLGSQVQGQVKIGSRSVLSLLPGYSNVTQFFSSAYGFIERLLHQ
jgi:hypothetical protein